LLSRLAYRRPRKVAPSPEKSRNPVINMIRRHWVPLRTAAALYLNLTFRALAALSLWGGLLFAPGIGGDRGL